MPCSRWNSKAAADGAAMLTAATDSALCVANCGTNASGSESKSRMQATQETSVCTLRVSTG
jgi:hypothetical protein